MDTNDIPTMKPLDAKPRFNRWRGRLAVAAACLALAMAFAGGLAGLSPVQAQGWWPWENGPETAPPRPREPVYRPPAQRAPPPIGQPAPNAPGTWGNKNPICLRLEQQLVQEGSRGNQSQNLLPMVDAEIRQVDQDRRQAAAELDRRNCYETFLFVKSLRNTRQCVDLSRRVEGAKRRLDDLEVQRRELQASAGQSYQDDIIRELARNRCGPAYEQQARQRDNGPFSNFWEEDSGGGPGGGIGTYGNLGYATYRTVCVRLCDGFYFPVSFSTLPNHFPRDAEVCSSRCAAPTELYYYQNPGGAVEQMIGVNQSTPYTDLKQAFRYRKEFVPGCSCKQAEFVPDGGAPVPGTTPGPNPGTDPGTNSGTAPGPAPIEGAAAPEQRAESVGENGWSAAIKPR